MLANLQKMQMKTCDKWWHKKKLTQTLKTPVLKNVNRHGAFLQAKCLAPCRIKKLKLDQDQEILFETSYWHFDDSIWLQRMFSHSGCRVNQRLAIYNFKLTFISVQVCWPITANWKVNTGFAVSFSNIASNIIDLVKDNFKCSVQ